MHPPAAATFHNFLWRIGIDGFISSEPNQEILRFINALLSFEGGYENKQEHFSFSSLHNFLVTAADDCYHTESLAFVYTIEIYEKSFVSLFERSTFAYINM